MDVSKHALGDIKSLGGGTNPPYTGLIPDVLPEVQKPVLAETPQTGVSTRYALARKEKNLNTDKAVESPHWYALRTTYGREKKASEFLNSKGILVFCPTFSTVREVNGKRRIVEQSRIPNIFFAYGTEEDIKAFVYDNVNLPFLRFYYHHFHVGRKIEKEPLIVPDNQIESLQIICTAEADDIIVESNEIKKFTNGQKVKITDEST